MWRVNGQDLSMAEGDYGIQLPITINGTEFTANDSLRITFKTARNGETILEKDFSIIVDSTINLELSETESALFPVGVYAYALDWYQNGNFLCNIIPCATLRVVDKA